MSDITTPKAGSAAKKPFKCVLCQTKHVSEHKHKLHGNSYAALRKRFPQACASLGKPLEERNHILVCCNWFVDDHPCPMYDPTAFLRSSAPLRASADDLLSPRTKRSLRRHSMPPSAAEQAETTTSDVQKMKSTLCDVLLALFSQNALTLFTSAERRVVGKRTRSKGLLTRDDVEADLRQQLASAWKEIKTLRAQVAAPTPAQVPLLLRQPVGAVRVRDGFLLVDFVITAVVLQRCRELRRVGNSMRLSP